MKTIFAALLILCCLNIRGQNPDTLSFDHKKSPGASLKFSFVQLSDIHIGESKTGDDYGTNGFNDTLTGMETGFEVDALRSSVSWINQNHELFQIKFVIITGDLTDSGERSEFLTGKKILDSLEVPYIPLIGNHDVWPYTGFLESAAPNGDSVLNEIYSSHFDTLQNYFQDWDNGTRLSPIYNPEAACISRFQNYSFVYDDYLFIFSDFGTRVHAPVTGPNSGPGVGPEANLMDFNGGTFNWLKQKISNYPDKGDKNIFIFSHHPFTKNPIGIGGGSFSYSEYGQVTEFLDTLRQHIAACFAGHLHQASTYGISLWVNNGTITNGIETDANKEFSFGHLRIINVYETVSGIGKVTNPPLLVYPNPSEGMLYVDFKQPVLSGDIGIYDLLGNQIIQVELKENFNKLDLRFLNEGIYILKHSQSQHTYKITIIKV